MKRILFWMPLLIAMVMLFSCSQEQQVIDIDDEVTTVCVLGPKDIVFTGADTRGTEITSSDVLRFTWATTDTLGIFPNKGNQVEFPITSSEGGTSAVFNGGGWALKNQSSYAAYYPFSVWNYHRNNQKILLDYSGQVQEGNGGFAHLSAYDYLASAKTTPSNNEVTFKMNRQGSILYIDIPVPVPCKVNSLVVSCDEAIFVEQATLDISGDEPTVTPIKMTKDLTLAFNNVETTEANENVRAYMAISPVNFTDKTVTATLNTDQGPYSAPVVSRAVMQGKAAFLSFSEEFSPIDNNFTDPQETMVEAMPVDLGLSVRWASFNIGATTRSEPGDYYAWGETETKSNYDWATYKWSQGSKTSLTKYNSNSANGVVDNLNMLESDDDVATKKWGNSWRTPTRAEVEELRNNCTWTYTTVDGVGGYLIRGKGTFINNTIFLPVTGIYEGTTMQSPEVGLCWTSECSSDRAYYLAHVINKPNVDGSCFRCYGVPVRPVTNMSINAVELNTTSLTLNPGSSFQLFANVYPANTAHPEVEWSCRNPNIVNVNSSGLVTAISTGTAIIEAHIEGITTYCNVFVTGRPLESSGIPDNEIWYTSTDGKIVEPDSPNLRFGSNMVSNTYENGKGIIRFSGDVIKIGYCAFQSKTKLKSIVLPSNVLYVDRQAFEYCINLEEVIFNDNIRRIGSRAFSDCSKLKEVSLPDGVTTLEGEAFANCTSLKTVELPCDPLTLSTDYEHTFAGCTNIETAILGGFISGNTLSGCFPSSYQTIVNVYLKDVTAIKEDCFLDCAGISELYIPEGVTSIGSKAFNGCSSLSKLVLPKSLTTVNKLMIKNTSISSLIFLSDTPPEDSSIQGYQIDSDDRVNRSSFGTCYVPPLSIDLYKKWFDYAYERCISLQPIPEYWY